MNNLMYTLIKKKFKKEPSVKETFLFEEQKVVFKRRDKNCTSY